MKKAIQTAAFCLLLAAPPFALAGSSRADSRAGIAAVSSKEPSHRQARKAMRGGKYDEAAQVYESIVVINANDIKARLGASFAYLKHSDYAQRRAGRVAATSR